MKLVFCSSRLVFRKQHVYRYSQPPVIFKKKYPSLSTSCPKSDQNHRTHLKVLPPVESRKKSKIKNSGIWVQIIGFLGPKTHRKDTGSFCARVVRNINVTPFGTCICPNPNRYLFNFRQFSVSDTKFQMDDFPKWILEGRTQGVETGCSKCETWVCQTFLHRYRWKKKFQ